jgi:hypothetical protein
MQFIKPFDHSEYSYVDGMNAKTARELKIIQAGAAIKRKDEWVKKILDQKISSKWRKELESQLSQEEISFLMDELRYYANLAKESSVRISLVDMSRHQLVFLPTDQ